MRYYLDEDDEDLAKLRSNFKKLIGFKITNIEYNECCEFKELEITLDNGYKIEVDCGGWNSEGSIDIINKDR
jgi:hypothetical protein